MTHVKLCNAPRHNSNMHVVLSRRQGHHLKIHLYHFRRQYECKAFGRRQYGYKYPAVANMNTKYSSSPIWIYIRLNIYECMDI